MSRYLTGITDDYRQTRRDEVLATQIADFRNLADFVDQLAKHGQVVVLGGGERLRGSLPDLELLEVL